MQYTPILALALCSAGAAPAITVTLSTSENSPAPIGAMVRFTATTDEAQGEVRHRFRVRKLGRSYQLIRDFNPAVDMDWTATANEGTYEIEVTARDLATGDTATTSTLFQFAPRATAKEAAVSPTANALVFLYSAPACESGGRMRVTFSTENGPLTRTPYKNCTGLTMNFHLAGMRPETNYTAFHTLDTGSEFLNSPPLAFTTGRLPGELYTNNILVSQPPATANPILLGTPLGGRPVANDLDGNVLWYGPDNISFVTRPETGGEMWALIESAGGIGSEQIVRRFDLTGMTLAETNAERVNEQLRAMNKREITAFHHEALSIPGGRVAVLADVEQILTDVQGPGPVDVLGDMILVLDKDMNVVWTWDTFDHLDVRRLAVLGEKCPAACPPTRLSSTGTDWTHGNAIDYTPDGQLLYSTRHQDWLVKVDYSYGEGDGHVIWRMGKDGDFTFNSSDPFPWFSHQHDGNFLASDPTRLLVFDDGNTRIARAGHGNSRGQVLQVDEDNLTVTPILNADLGVYSQAVGSAQILRDGNYHFDAGFVVENGTVDAYSIEVDPTGRILYNVHTNTVLYRSFRLTDMYTPN